MSGSGALWFIIVALGVGSFLLRFSFIGLVGNRPLPPWLLRHLRYTAVAILPALVTPVVVFSNESGTGPEPIRLTAAVATLVVGVWGKNTILTIATGAIILSGGLYLFG
ncbi:AzlD domain-containing protein [Ascidiaceihabitans sp.]|uniref:AzlD domain-containing protein n=1 Tax=Ascidiaceihabitans sp. TaxID=1872644 RepID=UPI003298B012